MVYFTQKRIPPGGGNHKNLQTQWKLGILSKREAGLRASLGQPAAGEKNGSCLAAMARPGWGRPERGKTDSPKAGIHFSPAPDFIFPPGQGFEILRLGKLFRLWGPGWKDYLNNSLNNFFRSWFLALFHITFRSCFIREWTKNDHFFVTKRLFYKGFSDFRCRKWSILKIGNNVVRFSWRAKDYFKELFK